MTHASNFFDRVYQYGLQHRPGRRGHVQSALIIMESASEDQKKELPAKIYEGSLIMALAQYEKEVSYLSGGINMTAELSCDK